MFHYHLSFLLLYFVPLTEYTRSEATRNDLWRGGGDLVAGSEAPGKAKRPERRDTLIQYPKHERTTACSDRQATKY
jgi:hypothetical protein